LNNPLIYVDPSGHQEIMADPDYHELFPTVGAEEAEQGGNDDYNIFKEIGKLFDRYERWQTQYEIEHGLRSYGVRSYYKMTEDGKTILLDGVAFGADLISILIPGKYGKMACYVIGSSATIANLYRAGKQYQEGKLSGEEYAQAISLAIASASPQFYGGIASGYQLYLDYDSNKAFVQQVVRGRIDPP
jgi:hypothetical protein